MMRGALPWWVASSAVCMRRGFERGEGLVWFWKCDVEVVVFWVGGQMMPVPVPVPKSVVLLYTQIQLRKWVGFWKRLANGIRRVTCYPSRTQIGSLWLRRCVEARTGSAARTSRPKGQGLIVFFSKHGGLRVRKWVYSSLNPNSVASL